ncbi:DUF5010 domain-containing protein [Streptomyces hyaluromycini]|uniref:DUF5010 domain-containing protein n=1 Tax=Streptomyces hyaluromycini TaxID=1377993 RepID=UPI000B5CC494|nr:DUF5010 domain-containing protein [Streptomyces hyaluromycini]
MRNPTSHRRTRKRLLYSVAALGAATGIGAAVTLAVGPAGAQPAAAVLDKRGSVLSHRAPGKTGALGVTFGFESETVHGIGYQNQIPLYDAAKGTTAEFWDNYVEELVTAGVDFVAVDTRGYRPGSAVPNDTGDPRALTGLVDAIKRGGYTRRLKIAALDDTVGSMTNKKNWTKHNTYGTVDPPFDMADATGTGEGGYQYLWDHDLRAYFQSIPDSMLYKVNGKPLIYLWSDNSPAFTNQGNGNSARLLGYVRSHARSEFDENPYLVVDNSWVQHDGAALSSVIDGADGWFGLTTPYTNQTYKGVTYGATLPGFYEPQHNMVIDPKHGRTLATNLKGTVNHSDRLTLVEGFADWQEGAALWRTEAAPYSKTQRDYPNQDINILRRYSRTPFPGNLVVQAETADAVHDTTPGNRRNVYRTDDLDTEPTTDKSGGWDVGSTATGEWEQWREVPMQGTENLKVRVATPRAHTRIRFVVDGIAGPVVSVPDTGGWQRWRTVDAGTFRFSKGTYHTVRLQIVTGGLNINWWQARRLTHP